MKRNPEQYSVVDNNPLNNRSQQDRYNRYFNTQQDDWQNQKKTLSS